MRLRPLLCYILLSYFAAHPNRPIPHKELLSAVWGPDYGDEHAYLRVFVNRLRKKIEPSPKAPKYLLKEPWVGYRLDLPKQQDRKWPMQRSTSQVPVRFFQLARSFTVKIHIFVN